MKNRSKKDQLKWAGGFVDGEGCIRIAKHVSIGRVNPIYNLSLSISQNCLYTLLYCQNAIGIQSSICVFPDRPSFRRPVHLLTYSCANARDAIQILLPYLVRKEAEAIVALEFAKRLLSRRGGNIPHTPKEIAIREGYYLRLRAMK